MARLARSEITVIDVLDGVDGDYISYVFRNSEAAPSKPTDGVYTGDTETAPTAPNAWSLEPIPPTSPEVTWVSKVRYYKVLGQTNWTRATAWSSPVKWTGKDGWNSKTINLFQVSATTPLVPDNTITYAFTDDSLTGSLDGWSTSTPSNTLAGGQIWITTNIARTQGTTDDLFEAGWSVPQVMSRNGFNGSQGLHGSGSYVYTTAPGYTIANFNSTFDGNANGTDVNTHSWLFLNIAGRVPQVRDVLSYVNDTATDPTLRFREDLLFNGTGWDGFVDVVNGNQIVHGTVAAEHLVSETITADKIAADAITASKILAGTITADRIVSNITFGVNATFTGTVKIGTTPLTNGNTFNSETNWADITGTANAPEDNATVNQSDLLTSQAISEAEVNAKAASDALGSAAAAITTAATNANSADKTLGTVGGWTINTNYIYSGTNTNVDVDGFATTGVILDQANAIRTPYFYTDVTGAGFKGDISAATGTLTAAHINAANIEGDVTDLKVKTTTFKSSINGTEQTVLSFTVAQLPFNRTIVVSGLHAKFDGVFGIYNTEIVGGIFRLSNGGTTYTATTTANYQGGGATIQSAPLVATLLANTAGTYSVSIERDLGYSMVASAHSVLIQVFKDGSTIS